MRSLACALLFASSLLFVGGAAAQTLEPRPPNPAANPNGNALTNPGLTPEIEFLYQLEAKFAADTAKGGGKAFGDYFAPDAVTLENGGAPVVGHDAIAAKATWTPESYQLTWTPEGARMGPAGDMGFTWGHYEGDSKDAQGNPVKETGRYMTVWKKQSDGSWKVILDASNLGPAEDCCRVK
jgi:ketosteroid isomerase-like protein